MTTEDERKVAPKPESKKREEVKKEPVARFVYVGPTLLDGLAETSVWKGGIPKKYEKTFERNPEFKSLFVDLKDLVSAQKEVSTPGTELHSAYGIIKEKGVI